jgi:hypothetical protein
MPANGEEINRHQDAEREQTLYMPVRMTIRLRMQRAARATAIPFRLSIDG